MLIEDVEQLQTWLTATLSLISEADPTALAKYVTALVKKDKPTEELKSSCIELLDIFLQRNTERFVEKLFNVLENNSYIVKPVQPLIIRNKKWKRKPRPSTTPGRKPQYKKASPITVSGNNQQYRKPCSVIVSGNNQQYRKPSQITVSENNQQYRKPSPVTVAGNNLQDRKPCSVTVSGNDLQYRKPCSVTVSGKNQQYRKPSPVTLSGNNLQYRKPCSVTVSGNNLQYRKPCSVTVSGKNLQYRKPSPVTVAGNNQQYRKPSPAGLSPSTTQGSKCQKRKSSPSSCSTPKTKHQNRNPSPPSARGSTWLNRKPCFSTDSSPDRQLSKYNQVPLVNKKGKQKKVTAKNALGPVSPAVSRNRDAISACDQRIVKLNPVSRKETLQSMSNSDIEKPTSDNPYLDTRSKDLGNDWLDYIEIQEVFDHTPEEDVEELLCFRRKGRGCMEPRHVPRLPLKATIQRMMSDDLSASGGHGGRGRARLLQNRARASKPQGLHKKRLRANEKREVIRPPFVMTSQIDSIEGVYIDQWQKEEFPRLIREDINNGSPKKLNKKASNVAKQTKSEARKHQEDIGEEITSGTDLLAQGFEQEVNHIPEAKIVNTTKAAKKKFDFSKANRELLQEFPIVKNSGPKILSLTQQNLEKFLRESDSESCSSQENSRVSHNASEENTERMPVYQRYAVTLDDIRKSKSSKVPPKVKGCLADLLEAMDTYCENPETYFDKMKQSNKESDLLNSVPNEKDSVTIETSDKKHDTLTCNNDLKISDKELRNAEAATNPQSNENIDGTLSNVSVVSDLSSLDSPSENELVINDDNVKDDNMNEGLEISHVKSNHIYQRLDTEKGLDSEIVIRNKMCNKEEFNRSCNGAKLTSGDHKFSIIKGEIFANELNVEKKKEIRTKSKHSYSLEKAVNIGSLDEIDLKAPPVSKSADRDLMGFQKVGSKQKKGKTPNDVKKTINGASSDQTIWRIYGRNAIQVDGLPANCDISELHGMVSGFGTVVDFQVRIINKATSVRFRLHNEDACEYAVQCLDQTDCLFPECNCKLSCHQLQT